jgi:hypothetical protein
MEGFRMLKEATKRNALAEPMGLDGFTFLTWMRVEKLH